MTLDERQQLQAFLFDLIQARATEKDKVAETLILEACARQPDALYLLVQRVMVLEQTLKRLLPPDPTQQSAVEQVGAHPVQQFLNPRLIASTALGAMAGSLLAQGLENWGESLALDGLTEFGADD
jgi:hypothetical protein